MTYWRATVERPDGEGGWTVVGVFGTKDTPGKGTARHLHGDTALDAAQLVLDHAWPINLQEHNENDDPGKWRNYYAVREIADYRITLDVTEDNHWSWRGDGPLPGPQSFTVAELRLTAVREKAAELAAAKEKLAEITEQARRAREEVRFAQSLLGGLTDRADRSGVPKDLTAKAARVPRRRKKSAS
jgi:hypothetical protein